MNELSRSGWLVRAIGPLGDPHERRLWLVLVFAVAIQVGYGWLAIVAAINTVVSSFYYVSVMQPMYTTGRAGPSRSSAGSPPGRYATTGAVVNIAIRLAVRGRVRASRVADDAGEREVIADPQPDLTDLSVLILRLVPCDEGS